MIRLAPFLLLVACGWLLAVLWLVLLARLLNQLFRADPAAYAALGRPVMRWLWWSWPTPKRGLAPRLFVQANVSLQLSTMYSLDEVASISRVVIWMALNRPSFAVTRVTKRQQRRLRACGIGFLLCFLGVVLVAVLGSG
jgi:hypothetical protein